MKNMRWVSNDPVAQWLRHQPATRPGVDSNPRGTLEVLEQYVVFLHTVFSQKKKQIELQNASEAGTHSECIARHTGN